MLAKRCFIVATAPERYYTVETLVLGMFVLLYMKTLLLQAVVYSEHALTACITQPMLYA